MVVNKRSNGGLWLLLLLAGGAGFQAIAGEPAAAVETSRFVFELVTPAPTLKLQVDGSHEIEIKGFETRQRRLGAPDLPIKTVLVAIPPRAVPRLEVRPGLERWQRGVRPRPVPRRVLAATNERGEPGLRLLHEQDRSIYEGDALFPREVAWFGQIGSLRDQRYVELNLAPVRYDPRSGALSIVTGLEVVVHFDGASSISPVPAHDPRFESTYRDAFVNYEQGLLFRDSPRIAPVAVAEVTAVSQRDGDTPRRKILVDRHGMVRLDFDRLNGSGFGAYDLSTWRVVNRGVAVPLEIQDDGDGILEPGEWVQFYGQALDDEPKTALNTDLLGDNDLYEARDFTDVNVYFLTVETEAQSPMTTRDGTPTMMRTPPDHFEATVHEEVDDSFKPLGAADPWSWSPTLVAGHATYGSRTDPVVLTGLHDGTLPATLRVKVKGRTENFDISPDHIVRISLLNGSGDLLAQEDGYFDNRTIYDHEVDWVWAGSGPELSADSEVEIEAIPVSGANNQFVMDYFEVVYRRSFLAAGESLTFDWPDSDAEFVVGGFQDATPAVYEITLADGEKVVQPVRLTGVPVLGATPPYSVRFRMDNDAGVADGQMRRFAVVGGAAIGVPGDPEFPVDTVSDLRDHANDAELVVIAHPDLADQQAGSALSMLLDHRATVAGGGLTSKVVFIEDVQDEFNQGLPGPQAIREFLRWVMSDVPEEGWAGRPSHVLLLGDGSYDYKGGEAAGNFIPTQIVFKDEPYLGYYSSDSVMGAVSGADWVPDLHIGRIPVRSLVEAEQVLTKILDSEAAALPGSWSKRTLFVSDRGKTGSNPTEALQFEGINDDSADAIGSLPYVSTKLRYWTDYYEPWMSDPGSNPEPISTMKAAIKSEVSAGVAIVQYIGHGNFTVWSDDAFFDERFAPRDSQELGNGGEMPWLMAHNCLTGGFHSGEFSVGADWLSRVGGGAMGVFAPTWLSYNYVSDAVANLVWPEIFGSTKERRVATLELMTRVMLCSGSVEACQAYVVLGDPASMLPIHSVEPATDVQALAGNAQVDLNWIASDTAGAAYDIYRTPYLAGGNYVKINEDPEVGTTYTDLSADNATLYHYYVVARDAEGFESAWSNFNSDCGVAGPDCVEATPLNPGPPGNPTGLLLEDPGIGDQLIVSWSANPETDLSHYTVHYGTESGVYTGVVDVDGFTQYTISGLVAGQDYFVALTATNTSVKTSGFSAEASDFPVSAPGLRPPAFIDGLTLARSGNDLVLAWDEVDLDSYGKEKQVQRYDVLRGAGPAFVHDDLVKVGDCLSPCQGWTDVGAAVAPDHYHYRVQAVDAEGTAGGLGSELPGITELGLVKSTTTAGKLVLEWSAVTSTLDGKPVELSHYALYAADQPFTRADIRDGLLPAPTTIVGTSVEFLPPAQNRYYSVLAVDVRGNASPQ